MVDEMMYKELIDKLQQYRDVYLGAKCEITVQNVELIHLRKQMAYVWDWSAGMVSGERLISPAIKLLRQKLAAFDEQKGKREEEE